MAVTNRQLQTENTEEYQDTRSQAACLSRREEFSWKQDWEASCRNRSHRLDHRQTEAVLFVLYTTHFHPTSFSL